MEEFTRKDYMAKKCTYKEYWSQFVTVSHISIVERGIGIDRIKNSTDEHLNDIPLKLWDSINEYMKLYLDKDIWRKLECPELLGTKKYAWSLSDGVSIAKEAARIIKDGKNE